MKLDHLFVFTEPGGGALLRHLTSVGLVESYRRVHPGQGTANVCICFDNAYLELLWVTDEAEASSSAIARTGLLERSRWRTAGTCAFGVAVREGDLPFETWAYRPPYLPDGESIPVAVESDDHRLPLVFRSPGTRGPAQWTGARARPLQHAAGFSTMSVVLRPLDDIAEAPVLQALDAAGVVTLGPSALRCEATLVLPRAGEPPIEIPLP